MLDSAGDADMKSVPFARVSVRMMLWAVLVPVLFMSIVYVSWSPTDTGEKADFMIDKKGSVIVNVWFEYWKYFVESWERYVSVLFSVKVFPFDTLEFVCRVMFSSIICSEVISEKLNVRLFWFWVSVTEFVDEYVSKVVPIGIVVCRVMLFAIALVKFREWVIIIFSPMLRVVLFLDVVNDGGFMLFDV